MIIIHSGTIKHLPNVSCLNYVSLYLCSFNNILLIVNFQINSTANNALVPTLRIKGVFTITCFEHRTSLVFKNNTTLSRHRTVAARVCPEWSGTQKPIESVYETTLGQSETEN